ncbi:MAG: recombinase family protein [Candidatus Methanoperedens sp.]|nr:recombinase family protein [Candidatus Methanoperedens sp.]
MKIAIYCRVSTDEQTTLNQEIRLVEYAKRMNWEYEVFNEVESSRKTRPIKAKVLDLLRKKEFNGVLVYKMDRWGRSLSELILELTELNNKGIAFISYSENLDFGSPAGRLMINLLASFAEFERDLIRQRTMEGLNRAKKEGKKLGRPSKSDLKLRMEKSYPVNLLKNEIA